MISRVFLIAILLQTLSLAAKTCESKDKEYNYSYGSYECPEKQKQEMTAGDWVALIFVLTLLCCFIVLPLCLVFIFESAIPSLLLGMAQFVAGIVGTGVTFFFTCFTSVVMLSFASIGA